VVGSNGIGKSVLIRVFAGVVEYDQGQVLLILASMTVGFLPQEPVFGVDESD